MEKEAPIINILTYTLPFELSNQIYNEFQSRFREAKYLIEHYETFKELEANIKTVELLLSLTIFHKRVILNLDAATKFYDKIHKYSGANCIKMGNYELTESEKNKILSVVISYKKIIDRFSIMPFVYEYNETKEFLKNLIKLKKILINEEHSTKNSEQNSSKDDEFPF